MPRFNDSLPIIPPEGSYYNLNQKYEQSTNPANMSNGAKNANSDWRHYGPIQNLPTKPDSKQDTVSFYSLPLLLLASLAVIFSAFAFYRANQVYLAMDQIQANLLGVSQNNNTANAAGNTNGTGPDNPTPKSPTPAKPTGPVDVAVEADDPIQGNPQAPVTIVEFSDFECPFCKRFAPTIDRILTEYKDKVRLVYRDFPLSNIHSEAQSAAVAAQCSFKLAGSDTFFKYHDELFANQSDLGSDLYKETAAKLGLNAKAFAACQKDPTIAAEVDKDLQDGIAAGVQGTPATFVNGQPVNGAVPYDQFKAIIESKIASPNDN